MSEPAPARTRILRLPSDEMTGGRDGPGRPRGAAAGVAILALVLLFPPAALARSKKTEDWPEIPAQEMSLKSVPQDPDADAVILLNTRDGEIVVKGKYLVNEITYHWRLKVLKEKGRRYADVRIPSDKFSTVSHIGARTVKPDGTSVEVPSESIFEKEVQRTRRSRALEYVFSFPAVEPGSILEYRYDRESTHLLIIPTWFFSGPEPTLHSRMSQAVPDDASYVTLCDKCPDPEPDLTPWKKGKLTGRLFTFDRHDIPAVREEPWMPPEREVDSRLEMVLARWRGQYWEALKRSEYLFTNWESVALYVNGTYGKRVELSQHALQPIVAGWIAGLDPKDTRALARAVYHHVQADVRYVDSDQVIGASRSVEDILATHSADNEEKAVLLAGALKAAGLGSRIVLVCARERGGLYMNFPSLAPFTQAIVSVPMKDGSVVWLDPTETYAPFGFLPARISGAAALTIDENGKLIVLPREEEPGRTRYVEDLTPTAAGGGDIKVEATLTGEDAMELREDLVPSAADHRTTVLQHWLDDRQAGARLKDASVEHLDDPDAPLVLKMTIDVPGVVTGSEDALLVRGCVLSCYDNNPIPGTERRYPIYLDRAWDTEEDLTVHVPPGRTVAPLPDPVSRNASVLNLDWSCDAPAAGTVRCRQRFTGASMHLQPGDAAALRSLFDDVVKADRNHVALLAAEPTAQR